MGDRSLYDTDIVAWADQQAVALRGLNARDLPNELDLANVIEEIEDVGRSETNPVTGFVRLILGHVAKGWADPRSRAMRHRAAEVGNWRNELLQHVTPSMRARIDLDLLWKRALRQADLDLAGAAGRTRVNASGRAWTTTNARSRSTSFAWRTPSSVTSSCV